MKIQTNKKIKSLVYNDYYVNVITVKEVQDIEIVGISNLAPPLRNVNKFDLSKSEPHVIIENDELRTSIPVEDILDIVYV